MPYRYRRARPEDIPRCWHLLEPDRPLFQASTWKVLPSVMADLLERNILNLCVLEDLRSGRPVLLGGLAFVEPTFMHRVLARPDFSASEHLFRSAIEGHRHLLTPRQVAVANASSGLELFSLFGVPENITTDPQSKSAESASMEAAAFFHRGYYLANFWKEYSFELGVQAMKSLGLTEVRQSPMSNGQTANLFRLTHLEAQHMIGVWIASVLKSHLPVFGFSRPEQKLLEYCLLDFSDRDFATEFNLTPDAVKKRWRSIYAKIDRVESALLANVQGTDRRRIVLQRIRNSLQEIRPYKAPKTQNTV